MGLTRFPNGVDVGTALVWNSGALTVYPVLGGTGTIPTTGTGTVTTGFGGQVSSFVAGLRNVPAGGGTTFGYIAGSAVSTGGAVVVTYYDKAGVQGTASTPFYWIATGTA